MMMRLPKLLLAAAACACLLDGGSPVRAANDHLKCYKMKETAGPGKATFTGVDLLSGIGLSAETGCVVKTPAKLFCGPVDKTGAISPPPPGGGPTGATTKFLCYKVKCPKGVTQTATATDQFGSHTLAVGVPKMLCAPAFPSGAFLDDSSVL